MISRFARVSATAPFHARMTFGQYSANRNGSPPKLLGGHAPLPCSDVDAGKAVQPIVVGIWALAGRQALTTMTPHTIASTNATRAAWRATENCAHGLSTSMSILSPSPFIRRMISYRLVDIGVPTRFRAVIM